MNQKLNWRAEGKLNLPQWRIVAILLNVIRNQTKATSASKKNGSCNIKVKKMWQCYKRNRSL